MDFSELNNDQRKETINTRQRFQAWQTAIEREHGFRGSMTWTHSKGGNYLIRSFYDERGLRRQRSLGVESDETRQLKEAFDQGRTAAETLRRNLDEALARQAAVNRALGLGRVPRLTARILRNLDRRGLLGRGFRVVGTNAIYCYEAACGVTVDPDLTTTDDIDFLYDARVHLHLISSQDIAGADFLAILRAADKSFELAKRTYSAQNSEGFMVDVIAPLPNPPWRERKGGYLSGDAVTPSEIEGLVWLENSPLFQQPVVDQDGVPLMIAAPDPRVFAIHKHWISKRAERDQLKRKRDAAQAAAVAALVRQYLLHLEFDASQLKMLPRSIVDDFLLAHPG